MQRLPRRARVRLRQAFRGPGEDSHDEHEEHPEDRAPAEEVQHRAAHDRRDGRGDPEDQRHLRHQPLRFRTLEAVADDGAADDEPAARGQSLQDPEQP